MLSKFLDPKNDYAFKRIFGTERNKDILIQFLNDILECKAGYHIHDVVFLRPDINREFSWSKQSIVDVLCQDEAGQRYVVEMQVAKSDSFVKRAQYYAAKAYTNQMRIGDDYHLLKEVIFIAITDFVMFKGKKAYKSNHIILDKKNHTRDLRDFSFTFIELPKFNKKIDELETNIDKWAYFFKHAAVSKELDPQKIGDWAVQKAFEELNQFSWSEEELGIYEHRIKIETDNRAVMLNAIKEGIAEGKAKGIAEGKAKGIAEGKAEGIAEGKAEGIELGKIEVAKNLLASNMTVSEVAIATELSEQMISSLIEIHAS